MKRLRAVYGRKKFQEEKSKERWIRDGKMASGPWKKSRIIAFTSSYQPPGSESSGLLLKASESASHEKVRYRLWVGMVHSAGKLGSSSAQADSSLGAQVALVL